MKQYLTGGKGRGCLWWASSHGGPRLWGIKERGGREVNENIRRGGWSGLVSGIFPCFGSLELRGGDGVFLLFFWHVLFVCGRGGPLRGVGKARDLGGGLVRYLQLHLH